MRFNSFVKSGTAAIFLFSVYLIFTICQARAAATIDSTASQGQFTASGVLQMTWPHTVGGGTSRALYVSVSTRSLVGPFPATRAASISYGGQPLTLVGRVFSPDFVSAVETYQMIAPPTGTANIIVNFIAVSDYAVGGSVSFAGVNQTTPNGAFVSASGATNTPAVTVVDSAAGDIVLDTLSAPPAVVNFAANPLQTLRWNGRTFFTSFDVGAGSTKPATGTTTGMSWTMTNAGNWVLGATAIKGIISTAAAVGIGGRVTDQNGYGLGKVRVEMMNADGETRAAITNPFGYYRFDDVQAGQTYVLSAAAKNRQFQTRTVTVNEDLSELNFTAENQ